MIYLKCSKNTLTKQIIFLENSKFNWYSVVNFAEDEAGSECCDCPELAQHLNKFFVAISKNISPQNRTLLKQSFDAYSCSGEGDQYSNTLARILSGDNGDDYAEIVSLASAKAQQLIAKRRKILSRQIRRKKANKIAERNFLGRRVSKRLNTIIHQCPGIGEAVESYVQQCNVGADAWRRTGVLTFDGNIRMKKKATYNRIKEYLEDKYQRKISYGTVQLCIARNRRRRSASNYKGVARATSRRARKGFEIKFNPDKHWSNVLYRGLTLTEYTEGTNITNINRDDASGYRLDTLTTHSQHATPSVKGQDVLTTHTDYLNRYPSILQTTSYNFTATKNTGELCAGVVKPQKIFPKNPAQHYADFKMLTHCSELQPAFQNHVTGEMKKIECIRVDGASDEGPSHEEVQFFWTTRHIEVEKLVTLVSSRSSGSSYLNRVELQNGCSSLAHANLFIPSTLNGSCMSSETGEVDVEKLRSNLNLATEIYIDRVNGCSCGDTVIHLFKGADSSDLQDMRKDLQFFLKGSKKKKELLRAQKPDLYKLLEGTNVSPCSWDATAIHLPFDLLFSTGLPTSCVSVSASRIETYKVRHTRWYPQGPQIDVIPLPVPDPTRPFGDLNCQSCSGVCAGHYLTPEEALVSNIPPHSRPPSVVLKEFYLNHRGKNVHDSLIEDIAREVLRVTL